MREPGRDAWITGVGMVSCLGEGVDAHWEGLSERRLRVDAQTFAPYVVHPLAAIDFDKQIPKKGDQRQMEPWQRIGTYAAGLALEAAGVKGNAEILGRTDLLVAAGGGERDLAVDGSVLTGLPKAENPAAYLNERLMSDLRPTLFLAQLSNLLAGNISIVHGVTGSSRTFMGEEAAGVDAVRVAVARIAAGQSDIVLVGSAFNGERMDMLMLYEFAGLNVKDRHVPVWSRQPAGGFALGSIGAFLVLEARQHAEARGAEPLARISAVQADRTRRESGMARAALDRMAKSLPAPLRAGGCAVLSGASGAEPATSEERAFLAAHSELPVRASGTILGHGMEAQFPLNVALGAVAMQRRKLFPPCDESGIEAPFEGTLTQVLVTGVGHWRGEGVAMLEAVD